MNKQVFYLRNKVIEFLKESRFYDPLFLVFHTIKTIRWYLKGKNTDTPHLVKQAEIKNYKKKYNTKILIETGTYMGTMVNVTKNIFSKIYTIEIDKKLYIRAKNKFKKFNHIEVLWGDSGKILPELLKKIEEPTLFWLDAHYNRGAITGGFKESPILDELTSILNHKIKNHIILIDDAEAFTGKNDYPKLKKLKKFISNKRPQVKFNLMHNIIRITPY